jgi:uncharacterized protein (UPF0548 family)
MNIPSSSVSSWFGSPKNDQSYLEQWHNVPLTYSPGQTIDENWHIDRYEILLGSDSSGDLFRRAAQMTLRNRFYPTQVMVNTSDFGLENRAVQVGDRVLQRIRILMFASLPILETLTLNEITEVIDEPRHKGFTYITTAVHSEMGEWSPSVHWRENGEVVLVIEVVSRTRPGSSRLAERITRWLQLRAHRLSIHNFRALLNGDRYNNQAREPFVPAELLPVGMLSLALFLFMLATRSYYNRSR